MLSHKEMQRFPVTWHKCSNSSLKRHPSSLQHGPNFVRDCETVAAELDLPGFFWLPLEIQLLANSLSCLRQMAGCYGITLWALRQWKDWFFPKPPRWLPHLMKIHIGTVSTLGGETISCLLQWKGLFFHPSSYWSLLRETARDELSQLKSLGLLNLVGWLAGQHYCNTKMTQPHSIFVGIPLAAAETIISLLLNRVCQWLGALLWKM